MKIVSKLKRLAFFLVVLLIANTAFGQKPTPEKTPEKADKPAISTDAPAKADKPAISADALESEDIEVDFPEVENWEKSSPQTFPVAELGYAVNYSSETAGRVTVYVYNAGLKTISADISDKRVKEEIEKTKRELRMVAEAGVYENLKEIKSETINLKGKTGLKSLYALFTFNVKGSALTSEIYLFTYKNHFIKIRATRPKESGEPGNKELAKLLAEIDTLFSK